MHVEIELAPQLQEERKRRRRWIILLVVLAVVVGAIVVGFKPLYGMVKGWRARRLAEKVEVEIREKKWQDAMNHAKAAYQLKPDEPMAMRAAAHLHGLSGRPFDAVKFWKPLLASGASVPEDHVGYATDLLKLGAVADAGREVEALLRDQPND